MLRKRICVPRSRSFVLREASGSSRRASLRGSFSHKELVSSRPRVGLLAWVCARNLPHNQVTLAGKRGLSGSFGLNEERLRKAQPGGQDPHPITTVDRSTCAQVCTHVETQVEIAVRTNSQPVLTDFPAAYETAPSEKRNSSTNLQPVLTDFPAACETAPADKRESGLTKADFFFMEEIEKVEKAAEEKRLAAHSFSPARRLCELSIANVEPLSPSPNVHEMSGSSRWLMFTDAAHVNLRRSTL